MINNKYVPSTFSRVIWLLLVVNSFAGVVLSHGSQSSVLLSAIFLIGSFAICIISFWKGTKAFGKLEYFCLGLLALSGVVWIFFNAPLINLIISLFAHFIGALPTYRKVWLNPESESFWFWSLFFFASLLSVFVAGAVSFKTIIFPIYFTLFDGSLFFLTLRKK
jgi:hypothetical protein